MACSDAAAKDRGQALAEGQRTGRLLGLRWRLSHAAGANLQQRKSFCGQAGNRPGCGGEVSGAC